MIVFSVGASVVLTVLVNLLCGRRTTRPSTCSTALLVKQRMPTKLRTAASARPTKEPLSDQNPSATTATPS